MKRRLLFTIDVDRDANLHIDGADAAGSMDRGSGTSPRFGSTEKGLSLIGDLLDELGIKATFFIEGRTAETVDCSFLSGHCIGFHGYDHEDLSKVADVGSVMRKGYEAVKDRVSKPECFRAPFMTMADGIYEELNSLGVRHDSSVYGPPDSSPYEVSGVMEHPVAKGKDASGKTIAAYLWPMHEGKRTPSDYVDLARSVPGDLVLCTHSWHIVEGYDSGPMSEEILRRNIDRTKEVLEGIIDVGFSPCRLTE